MELWRKENRQMAYLKPMDGSGTGDGAQKRRGLCNNCGVYMRFVGERREHKIHVAAEELASPPEPESHPQ